MDGAILWSAAQPVGDVVISPDADENLESAEVVLEPLPRGVVVYAGEELLAPCVCPDLLKRAPALVMRQVGLYLHEVEMMRLVAWVVPPRAVVNSRRGRPERAEGHAAVYRSPDEGEQAYEEGKQAYDDAGEDPASNPPTTHSRRIPAAGIQGVEACSSPGTTLLVRSRLRPRQSAAVSPEVRVWAAVEPTITTWKHRARTGSRRSRGSQSSTGLNKNTSPALVSSVPPGDAVRAVKDRLDMVDVIQQYVRLQRAGSEYKGLCPFHSENSPSFTVNPEKQIFYCFGCQVGGDLFDFVQRVEGTDFPQTLQTLAERAGVEL